MIDFQKLNEVVLSLEKNIQCGICLETYKTPTLTKCGHLFCQFCIQSHAKKSSSKCPVCQGVIGARGNRLVPEFSNAIEAVKKLIKNINSESSEVVKQLSENVGGGKGQDLTKLNDHDPFVFIGSQSIVEPEKKKKRSKRQIELNNLKTISYNGDTPDKENSVLFCTPEFQEPPTKRIKKTTEHFRESLVKNVSLNEEKDKSYDCDENNLIMDTKMTIQSDEPTESQLSSNSGQPDLVTLLDFDALVGSGSKLKLNKVGRKYSCKPHYSNENKETKLSLSSVDLNSFHPGGNVASPIDDLREPCNTTQFTESKTRIKERLNKIFPKNFENSSGFRVPFIFNDAFISYYFERNSSSCNLKPVKFFKLGNLSKSLKLSGLVDNCIQVSLCQCLAQPIQTSPENHKLTKCFGANTLMGYSDKKLFADISIQTDFARCETSSSSTLLQNILFPLSDNLSGNGITGQESILQCGQKNIPVFEDPVDERRSIPETEDSCDMFESVGNSRTNDEELSPKDSMFINKNVLENECSSSSLEGLILSNVQSSVQENVDTKLENLTKTVCVTVVPETPVSPSFSDERSEEIPLQNHMEGMKVDSSFANIQNKPFPIHNDSIQNQKSKLIIACTNLDVHEEEQVTDFVETFGGKLTEVIDNNTSHVVVKHHENLESPRTVKFLFGIAHGKWIVSHKWVVESLEKFMLQKEDQYEVKDETGICSPMIARTNPIKILKDFEICCFGVNETDSISAEQIKKLVTLCGGEVVPTPNMFSFEPHKVSLLISTDEPSELMFKQFNGLWRKYKIIPVAYFWLVDSISMYRLAPLKEHLLLDLQLTQLQKLGLPTDLLKEF